MGFVLRDAAVADERELIELGIATGLFSAEEADTLLGATLRGLADGSLSRDTHVARVVTDGGGARAGWTYLSADDHADGVWELWWIGVSRAAEGTGAGRALLADAEAVARAAGARLLVISTSSTEATARARAFYERRGYFKCGQVPDFYGDGDDKVVFARRLVPRV